MANTFTPSVAHAAMACPKCAGEMRAYERSGVIVDQCRECRGIFLDRGELEHLVDLEVDPGDRRDPRADRDDRSLDRPAPRRSDDRRDEPARYDDRREDRPDPRRDDDRRAEPPRYDDRRDQRAGGYAGDRRESPVEALGDVGELGGLGELGDLLGRRDRSRTAPDPRSASSYPPKKRSSFFKDLLEGFGE